MLKGFRGRSKVEVTWRLSKLSVCWRTVISFSFWQLSVPGCCYLARDWLQQKEESPGELSPGQVSERSLNHVQAA